MIGIPIYQANLYVFSFFVMFGQIFGCFDTGWFFLQKNKYFVKLLFLFPMLKFFGETNVSFSKTLSFFRFLRLLLV